MKKLFIHTSMLLLPFGCAYYEETCEDVSLISEQTQQCQILYKQISGLDNKPIRRTELERRYQQDCVDIRYYRDEKQPNVCNGKTNTIKHEE